MKTIAVREKTFQLLKDLKEKERADSFDDVVTKLVIKEKKIPDSMFGAFRGKIKSFTRKERKNMWKDEFRAT